METLLWIVVAFALAIGIARWNESNKLFWILFTSLMVGIAGGSLYKKLQSKQSEVHSYEGVSPTQGSNLTLGAPYLLASDSDETAMCLEPKLVSQDITPDTYEYNFTLVKGFAKQNLKPPMILYLC